MKFIKIIFVLMIAGTLFIAGCNQKAVNPDPNPPDQDGTVTPPDEVN